MKGELHIIAGYKNDTTYLKESFCKQPFKLANITEQKAEGLLRLMIMSSSPGVLDHDYYTIEVQVEDNAKVHLTTQGYQRLFAMSNYASQCMNVHVRDHASFCFLPHPNVPHATSDFLSVNNIYLHKNSQLTWSEIITCGRKGSGEEFKFTRYHNITNVYLNDKLVVKENVLLEPLKINMQAMGQLEGYTHQSTLLFIDDRADMKEISLACKELLSQIEDMTYGISKLAVNGIVIRTLGQKSELLFNCNKKLSSLIQKLQVKDVEIKPEIISSVIHLKTSEKL